MAKKKKSELKQGTKRFDILGRVSLTDSLTNVKIDVISDSGYVYNSMNLSIDCGDAGKNKVKTFGGAFPEDHDEKSYLYLNKSDYSGQIKVEFCDRNNKQVLEKLENEIAKNNYFRAGMEFPKGEDYPLVKQFLSEYDLIEYVNEHLEDGDILQIRGAVASNIYNGNVNKELQIEYIAKRKEEMLWDKLFKMYDDKSKEQVRDSHSVSELFHAEFQETLYFTNDSVGRKDKDSGETPVTAYVVEYINKVDGKDIKSTKVIPTQYWIKNDKLSKYLTAGRGKITKVTVEGEIVNKNKTKQLTFEELDDTVKELIEDGLMSKEDAIGKATVYGGFISRRYINAPAIYTKELDSGDIEQKVQFFKDFLDDDSELFEMVLDIESPEEADLNESYEEENEEVLEQLDNDEDEDLDDILAGL